MTCASLLAGRWRIANSWVPPLIFGLGVLLLLPSIWAETSVTGMDEYWLSFRTPMEMRERGQWLTPWLNGEPRLQKPPLLYWAILANYKLFGVNLISARIWGVLSGAGLALCACLFSRLLFQRDGLLAGLMALATIGVAVDGRRAMLDLPSAFFSTTAVLFFLKWLRCGGLADLLWAALLLGLSFMTKGPVGLLFFGAGALAALTLLPPDRAPPRKGWHMVLAVLLLAIVSLPWPLAMHHLWSERLSRILGEELQARQFGHWTPGSPLSALGGALGLAMPWTPLVLVAIYFCFQRRSDQQTRQSRFLLGWFIVAALPFFFMRAFERYMLALIPAQVVLAAEFLEQNPTRARRIALRIGVAVAALLGVATGLFAWWFKLAPFGALGCLLLAAGLVFLSFRPVHPHWVALSCSCLFSLVLGGVYPALGINALPENLPADLALQPVRLFNPPQPSLLSMRLGRSAQAFHAERPATNSTSPSTAEIVFVEQAHSPEFLAQLRTNGLKAEDKGHFHSFYSRRAWIRFARPDAGWQDWKRALQDRSLENLKSEFLFYKVTRSRLPE